MAIEWTALKADYESGRVTVDELAKKYGCKAQTIDRRAVKEGWSELLDSAVKVKSKARPKKKIKKARALPKRSRAEESQRILGEHRRLWQSVKGTLVEGMAEGDEKRLKVAKIAGDGLLNIVKGERQAWGITEDSTGASAEELLGAVKEMEEATAPLGTDSALEGE